MEMDFKAKRHNSDKRQPKIMVQFGFELLYQFSDTLVKRV